MPRLRSLALIGATTTAALLASALLVTAPASAAPGQATGASAAAPTITINATSKLGVITNDVAVVYHAAGGYGGATIHGKITGAAAGDVATLYYQRFPYKKPAAPLASKTLTAGTQTYSFKVTPPLATRYTVRLFPSSTSHTPIATSKGQNVYVLANGNVTGGNSCQNDRPVCHETYHVYTILPPSALSTEIGKHLYPYVGVNLSPTSVPPPPRWLYLNAYHSSVTTGHRISAGEFVNIFTFRFTLGNDGYRFNWVLCTRDTVSKDGLGLPGSHGCGYLQRVSGTNIPYLG